MAFVELTLDRNRWAIVPEDKRGRVAATTEALRVCLMVAELWEAILDEATLDLKRWLTVADVKQG